ncbi:hypothetical protein J2T12_000868 [Paenibacillus anaericanus]|uniref:hypothetical protein n=1 Tax=Paenibacillus anaericanus TaxID=170367 RepID=UPI00277DA4D3|nr:hypothetical protein [Paenibacillus anaericanus]MDQ0087474.1 hypothetical protein [Paenibacillus anaericanus]
MESDSNKNEAEIIEKVREFGVNYFKERYDADVEFTEFNVRPPHIDRSVGMQGHIVGDEEQHIYLLVNYVTYEVIMGTAPVGFTDSHPNLKEDSVN